MATTAPVASQSNAVQLRTVALSAIVALDGWNPRMSFPCGMCRGRGARPVWRPLEDTGT